MAGLAALGTPKRKIPLRKPGTGPVPFRVGVVIAALRLWRIAPRVDFVWWESRGRVPRGRTSQTRPFLSPVRSL
jgi:hypothetical protein